MKLYFNILILLMAVSMSAQTVIPLPGFQAVMKEFPVVENDSIITATFFITDFSNQYNGLDLKDREDLVIWRNCQRYAIDTITELYATKLTVKLNKLGNKNLVPGVCALLAETSENKISHLISGITDSDRQCIDSYYRKDFVKDCDSLLINGQWYYCGDSVIIEDNVIDADSDPTNEIQHFSLLPGSFNAGGYDSYKFSDGNTNSAWITEGINTNIYPWGLTLRIDAIDTSGNDHIANDLDLDPTNELQVLSISNDTIYLNDGGFVVLPEDNDSDPTNELQALSISNDTIYLSDGGFVVIPEDNDSDPTNELQVLSISNDTIYLSDGGFVVIPEDNDSDPTNELQVLSISNDTIYLSDGGFVVLPEDNDSDPTNELQVLSISNDTIYLSDGGFVVIPEDNDSDPTNELQVLSISNDTIYLSDGGFVVVESGPDEDWDVVSNALVNANNRRVGINITPSFMFAAVDSIGSGTGDYIGYIGTRNGLDGLGVKKPTVSNPYSAYFLGPVKLWNGSIGYGGLVTALDDYGEDGEVWKSKGAGAPNVWEKENGIGVDLFLGGTISGKEYYVYRDDNNNNYAIFLEGDNMDLVKNANFLELNSTDNQTISYSYPNLSILNGNSVDLSNLKQWQESTGYLYHTNRVGIGSIPSYDLDVQKTSAANFRLRSTSAGANFIFDKGSASASNVMLFSTSGTENFRIGGDYRYASDWSIMEDNSDVRFIVKNGGQIGINTPTPAASLDVNGDVAIRDISSGPAVSGLGIDANDIVVATPLITEESKWTEATAVKIYSNYPFVGIGATPTYNLDVQNSSAANFRLRSTGAGANIFFDKGSASASNVMLFSTSGTENFRIGGDYRYASDWSIMEDNSDVRFIVKNGGQIGINTPTPAASLDVNGDVKISDLSNGVAVSDVGVDANGKLTTNGVPSSITDIHADISGESLIIKDQSGTELYRVTPDHHFYFTEPSTDNANLRKKVSIGSLSLASQSITAGNTKLNFTLGEDSGFDVDADATDDEMKTLVSNVVGEFSVTGDLTYDGGCTGASTFEVEIRKNGIQAAQSKIKIGNSDTVPFAVQCIETTWAISEEFQIYVFAPTGCTATIANVEFHAEIK